jgi:Rod binding domain-containing protein
MTGPVFDIPSYSVPKEAFESQKTKNFSNRQAALRNAGYNSVPKSGSASQRGGPVATFTVEEFKKGVNIGTQSPAQNAPVQNPNAQNSGQVGSQGNPETSELPGIKLSEQGKSRVAEVLGDLPAGAYGRRYRPLENGRMADVSQKLKGMSEEQKISKLKQIKESAEEYEGFLINEMIKNMRQSPFVKTPGSDTYSEIAEKPFTAALTKAGGLGLSQTIVNQVAAQEGLADVLTSHPEVMGPNWRQRLAPSQMPKAAPRLMAGHANENSTIANPNSD